MATANKYNLKSTSPLWQYVTPTNTGILLGVTLAAFPSIVGQEYNLVFVNPVFQTEVIIPRRFYLGVLGVLAGFVSSKTFNWARWKLLKSLLTYQEWIFSHSSWRTKTWGVLVKALIGPVNHSTYTFQSCLPQLPVPSLHASLDRWLEAAEPMITADEFEMTKTCVKHFRENEGPMLQTYLLKKAKTSKSWIYDYWTNFVYLASRQPLAVNSNYFAAFVHNRPEIKEPVAKTAAVIRNIADFYDFLESEQFPPTVLNDVVPLCMNSFQYMFNTVRIPMDYQDELKKYPGHSHIIVIRNGHYFKIDLRYQDTSRSLLTENDLQKLIQEIRDISDKVEPGLPVAALTGQRRDVWAKQRMKLLERNSDIMRDIETAAFITSLNEKSPADCDEAARMALTSTVDSVWFDKSISITVFDNGVVTANVEHTGVDAMIFTSLSDFLVLHTDNKKWKHRKDTRNGLRNLPVLQRLSWDFTDMEENVSIAAKEVSFLTNDAEVCTFLTKYGKTFIKSCKLSPDGYLQMMIQLAYFKIHHEFAKQYAPSTLRLFHLGRTETVNPMSPMSLSWIQAMHNNNCTKETKKALLQKAVEYQARYRLDATVGRACDRHLFALMCASLELGIDMPSIFMDKPWKMPYKLSTSQSPSRVIENEADHTSIYAGFGPSCHDGYGISYIPYQDSFSFSISSYKSCESTSSAKLSQAIFQAMDEMKDLFDTKQHP